MKARTSSVVSFVLVSALLSYGAVGCAAPTEDAAQSSDALSMVADPNAEPGALAVEHEATSHHRAMGTVSAGDHFADAKKAARPALGAAAAEDMADPFADASERAMRPAGGTAPAREVLVMERDSARAVVGSVDADALSTESPTVRAARGAIGARDAYGMERERVSADLRADDLGAPASSSYAPHFGSERLAAPDFVVEGKTVRPSSGTTRAGAAPSPFEAESAKVHTETFGRTTLPNIAPETSCYDTSAPLVLEGGAPPRRADACTASDITAFGAACLASLEAPACVALRAEKPACARCIVGDKSSLGAIHASRAGKTTVNVGSCVAYASERKECAAPLAIREACIDAACNTCSTENHALDCRGQAANGVCAGLAPRECEAVADSREAWAPKCVGATKAETFARVAGFYCGE